MESSHGEFTPVTVAASTRATIKTVEPMMALRWRFLAPGYTEPLSGAYIPDAKVLEQAFRCVETGHIEWREIPLVK